MNVNASECILVGMRSPIIVLLYFYSVLSNFQHSTSFQYSTANQVSIRYHLSVMVAVVVFPILRDCKKMS